MRDEKAQEIGPFYAHKGERLEHRKLIDFINRNYMSDEIGRYYFQNGPQRVYVELERSPWVFRIHERGEVYTHTHELVQPTQGYIDETGRVYLDATCGLGIVHSQDMILLADEAEKGRWKIQEIHSSEMEKVFGFVISPEKKLNATGPSPGL